MATNIHDFKESFRGGVRPNLFRCSISHTVGIGNVEFLCKGTQIPSSTIGNIDVPFRGRQLKVPGDRTFTDWTVTILNDPDFAIRAAMEDWSAKINHHGANVSTLNHSNIYGNATVVQLGRQGNALRNYYMEDIYPTEIAAIELSMDSNDTVEEYSVTFAVNNWYSDQGGGLDRTGARDGDWEIGVRGRVQVGPVSIGINTNIGG
jgi:hypothetical protein|tara:strand:+ start:172 stop:786 length:615 start_codon:yes stop_codon:yes gene_type:complete